MSWVNWTPGPIANYANWNLNFASLLISKRSVNVPCIMTILNGLIVTKFLIV